MNNHSSMQTYIFHSLIILSVFLGGAFGYFYGPQVAWLKPLGEIFLHLILTTIVPMIFFSVSLAIAKASLVKKVARMLGTMLLVFIGMGCIAAILSLVVVVLLPPAQDVILSNTSVMHIAPLNLSQLLVHLFTVTHFTMLFSHENIFPLIIFSSLIGLACASSQAYGTHFMSFLEAGEVVFIKVFSLVMYFAPIGFFAYFAGLVHEFGPQLMKSYARIAIGYALFSILYLLVLYTLYAWIASGKQGVHLFWKNSWLTILTALATCSSAATIPANLLACRAMGISHEVSETVIPLGTMLHKQGSIIGGIVKIAFLFGIYHMGFSTPSSLFIAIAVALLVGTVMGAIPSGGMLGELLIISVYGFPASALVSIVAISMIIDPFATMLNASGNSVAAMLIGRFTGHNRSNPKMA